MEGTRAGGFVLTRELAAGKWGAATYALAQTMTEASEGAGHRDHRGHGAEAEPDHPPMPPVADGVGDADETDGEL